MNDLIHINDILLRTIIGIDPDERINRQDVIINLTLWTDIQPPAHSEDIADAVNYRDVCKRVIAFVEASQYGLLETLVEEVAALILRDFAVPRVRVRIDKPGALRFCRTVGIEIERTRN